MYDLFKIKKANPEVSQMHDVLSIVNIAMLANIELTLCYIILALLLNLHLQRKIYIMCTFSILQC